jgi:hypothetical protein
MPVAIRRPDRALGALGALAVLAVPALLASPATAGAPPAAAPAPGDCADRTSWLAGTTELCAGALVYRDYVMDDYGAADELDQTNRTVLLGGLSPTAGDERYPDRAEAGTADLIDLTMRIEGDRLVTVFETNALFEPDSTIGALAVDTDADAATGGGEWPGLGIRSTGWDVLEQVATGDVATNTLVLSMPVPSGDRWRVQAVTAQADGTVMNVAFRGIDEVSRLGTSTWWEGEQAAALGDGDISRFGADVDVADLRRRVTRPADHAAAGYHERVFTSAHTIASGEGYSYVPEYGRKGNSELICEQKFVSFGRYQPYSVYVPEGVGTAAEDPGLQLYLHGCNANHSSQIDGDGDAVRRRPRPGDRGPARPRSGGLLLRHQRGGRLRGRRRRRPGVRLRPRQLAHLRLLHGRLRRHAARLVLPAPVGRHEQLGRLHRRRAQQRDRPPAPKKSPSGAIDNVFDYIGNQLWIPSENLYAAADELVQVSSTSALALRMREAGLDHGYYLHPAAEHLTFLALDDWRKEAAASKDRRRVVNPPRVRFRMDAALGNAELGILHDRAYWVSAIRQAGEGFADLDLTSAGCGGALPVRESENSAGPSPVPWVSEEIRTTGAEPLARADRLDGALVNVRSLRVDTDATCLTGKAIDYALETDGPLTLLTSDGRTLELPAAGRHEGVLAAPAAAGRGSASGTPAAGPAAPDSAAAASAAPDSAAAASAAAGSTRARALPATGADVVVPLLGAGLLLVAAAARRRAGVG